MFVRFVLTALAAPILFVRWMLQHSCRWRSLTMSYTPYVKCRNCAGQVSLVGIWRCGCGHTYRGHLMRDCPVCGSFPKMVRCYACGVTEVLPQP